MSPGYAASASMSSTRRYTPMMAAATHECVQGHRSTACGVLCRLLRHGSALDDRLWQHTTARFDSMGMPHALDRVPVANVRPSAGTYPFCLEPSLHDPAPASRGPP